MKPQDFALRLLPYIGVNSFDLTANPDSVLKRPQLAGDLEFLAGCMTGGISQIFADGTSAWSEQRYGDVLHAPTSVAGIGVTQYSKAITFSGYQNWMQLCTFRLGGDDQDNELVSGTQLLYPYMGSTGTVSGVVYGDTLKLPQGTDCVLDPVELPKTVPLIPSTSRQEFRAWNIPHDYGNPPQRPGSTYYIQQSKSIGQPAVYFCEPHNDPALGLSYIPLYLHVNPMPNQAYRLYMRLKIEAPTFQASDFGDASSAPDIPIPANWHELVVYPYVAMRFTGHNGFTNKQAKEEILRQFQAAKEKVISWKPTASATIGQFIGP
jgi:hypothetical protein